MYRSVELFFREPELLPEVSARPSMIRATPRGRGGESERGREWERERESARERERSIFTM